MIPSYHQQGSLVNLRCFSRLPPGVFCKKTVFKNLRPATFFTKKRLRHRCSPVNFAKLLRTPILNESLRATASASHICDALSDLVSVTIWRLHGSWSVCECLLAFFSTFMSFLSICMSLHIIKICLSNRDLRTTGFYLRFSRF